MIEDSPTTSNRLSANRMAIVLGVLGLGLLVLYRIGIRAEGAKDIVWFS
ncbi:MAG: hypothetical protein LC770_04605 [Acidobacteria bacterium]|nr:hypothetical protein [Acidobacteriota bacterium]